MHFFRLLALSGSLRRSSSNSAVLRTLQLIAPPEVDIVMGDISALPLHNPDIDADKIQALRLLKQQLTSVDGVIIASPQTTFSVSSPMKNALDWLNSDNPLADKPVMLINTKMKNRHGTVALQSILQCLSAQLISEANAVVSASRDNISPAGTYAHDSTLCQRLRERLNVFCTSLTQEQWIAPHDRRPASEAELHSGIDASPLTPAGLTHRAQ